MCKDEYVSSQSHFLLRLCLRSSEQLLWLVCSADKKLRYFRQYRYSTTPQMSAYSFVEPWWLVQAKVHSLEMSNYSLSMHLRQATGTPRPDRSHPDVF